MRCDLWISQFLRLISMIWAWKHLSYSCDDIAIYSKLLASRQVRVEESQIWRLIIIKNEIIICSSFCCSPSAIMEWQSFYFSYFKRRLSSWTFSEYCSIKVFLKWVFWASPSFRIQMWLHSKFGRSATEFRRKTFLW